EPTVTDANVVLQTLNPQYLLGGRMRVDQEKSKTAVKGLADRLGLGVMETARRMLARLGRDVKIDEEDRCVCLCAALLHDLGHGPFSHVFERVTNVHHERLTRRIIVDGESEIHRLLISHDKSLPERVNAMLEGRAPKRFLSDIISSTLDADRFDYLLRDNLMTGSRYGGFDLQWLILALAIEPKTQRLVVLPKAVSAIESYLSSRYHMYRNVYFHKVVRSAEGMLKLALKRARRLAVQDRLQWPTRESNVARALAGQRLSIEDFVDLDDVSLMQCFKVWARSNEDRALAMLSRGLLFRKLFKSIDVTHDSDANQAFVRAAQAVLNAGGDPEYDIFLDEPVDMPYAFDPDESASEKGIKVLERDGSLRDIAEVSPMTVSLNQQLGFKRIHVAEQFRDVAQKAVSD
ncbi:MAG TPA: HD domain-containing protein, partial [Tepidisphaeraceae bacterium]|nr:HD domain-containing protein [Tepidisphaeraceae bacterium]